MSIPWEGLVGAVGGGGLTKLADMFLGRKGREVRTLGDAIDKLSDQLKKADDRMDDFGDRLDTCHKQHEDCERGRKEDRREIEDLKDKLTHIDRMMAGDVPRYQPTDLRRVTPKKESGRR